ncbi:hypothetical protein BC364_26035 [Ensifer sp. LC499]|nr:hypothetical protein BBX50_26035 [Ensifer sp. LC11]OCP30456.1 hypothetical protein BC364_26035 [Ensifer sp. LC499]
MILVILTLIFGGCVTAPATAQDDTQSPANLAATIAAVEHRLAPAASIAGQPTDSPSLADEMPRLHVPGAAAQ